MDRRSLLHKQPFIIAHNYHEVITAHFLHHCTLKQALLSFMVKGSPTACHALNQIHWVKRPKEDSNEKRGRSLDLRLVFIESSVFAPAIRCGQSHPRRNLDLQRLLLLLLLLVNDDAEPTDLFLDGRQNGHYGGQRVLIVRHETPHVVNVFSRPTVVLDVVLDMLEPDVHDPQGPLDRVHLRYRQQLDCRGRRTIAARKS